MTPETAAAKLSAMLQPFLRHGKPVELTSADYARRAKTTQQTANMRIMRLRKGGLTTMQQISADFLHSLTPAGIRAALFVPAPVQIEIDIPAPPVINPFKRIFITDLDLSTIQDQIRDHMQATIPADARPKPFPKAESYTGLCRAHERAEYAPDVIRMRDEGLTWKAIERRIGVHENTCRQAYNEAVR